MRRGPACRKKGRPTQRPTLRWVFQLYLGASGLAGRPTPGPQPGPPSRDGSPSAGGGATLPPGVRGVPNVGARSQDRKNPYSKKGIVAKQQRNPLSRPKPPLVKPCGPSLHPFSQFGISVPLPSKLSHRPLVRKGSRCFPQDSLEPPRSIWVNQNFAPVMPFPHGYSQLRVTRRGGPPPLPYAANPPWHRTGAPPRSPARKLCRPPGL